MLTRIDGTPFYSNSPARRNSKPHLKKEGRLWRCSLIKGIPCYGPTPEEAFSEWHRMVRGRPSAIRKWEGVIDSEGL